jgi:hypothetical protein
MPISQIIEDFTFVGMAQPNVMQQPFGRGAEEILDLIDIFIMNFRYDGRKQCCTFNLFVFLL